jgi:hypothetical protein
MKRSFGFWISEGFRDWFSRRLTRTGRDRGRMPEVRCRRAEGGGRRTEVGRQRTDVRGRVTEDGGRGRA